MRIFIDADGCPVIYETIKVALEYNILVNIVSNTSHIFNFNDYNNVKVIVADKGKDIVDFIIVNSVLAGDIVITQDYGLATMCLAKKAFPISQNGIYYTDSNIDKMLFDRHISRKERKFRNRTKKINKRTEKDNERFRSALLNLIKKKMVT